MMKYEHNESEIKTLTKTLVYIHLCGQFTMSRTEPFDYECISTENPIEISDIGSTDYFKIQRNTLSFR